jgi:hypothetical protein
MLGFLSQHQINRESPDFGSLERIPMTVTKVGRGWGIRSTTKTHRNALFAEKGMSAPLFVIARISRRKS